MHLRPEQPADVDVIRALTARAFEGHPHSDGSEPAIVDRLRTAEALTVSLVAMLDDQIIGHVAISPVEWDGGDGWFGLGPVSVDPRHQRRGVGAALIRQALDDIRIAGAAGCVVAGDPAYYDRFGFRSDPRWTYPGLPPEYFMAQAFTTVTGSGGVRYHPAFG